MSAMFNIHARYHSSSHCFLSRWKFKVVHDPDQVTGAVWYIMHIPNTVHATKKVNLFSFLPFLGECGSSVRKMYYKPFLGWELVRSRDDGNVKFLLSVNRKCISHLGRK